MMSVTLFTDFTISSIVDPASATSFDPAHLLHRIPDQPLISLAAFALLCARFLTSVATTANPTLLPGTRSLHRRVQRQNVGLERNPVDHADDVHDLLRRRGDRLHRPHHLAHHRPAFTAIHWLGVLRQLVRLSPRCRRSASPSRSAAPCWRPSPLRLRSLLLRPLRQVRVARRDLLRRRGDRPRRLPGSAAPATTGVPIADVAVLAQVGEHSFALITARSASSRPRPAPPSPADLGDRPSWHPAAR